MIIGMTLAEVFLLLLVVGWYGSRLETEATTHRPTDPANVLQQELDDARESLKKEQQNSTVLQTTIRNYEKTLDWLGEHLSAGRSTPPAPIRDIATAQKALGDYTVGLKRGKPVCADKNVLVEVVADNVANNENFALQILQPFESGDLKYVGNGQESVTGQTDVDHFLSAVGSYYSTHACAFDFHLSWRTDHDYRTAKEKFDPFFYPAGNRQLK